MIIFYFFYFFYFSRFHFLDDSIFISCISSNFFWNWILTRIILEKIYEALCFLATRSRKHFESTETAFQEILICGQANVK